VERLATQHIELFKQEITRDVTRIGEGAITLIVGLNVFFIGGVLLAFALAHGLAAANLLPLWASFLVVGILVCIIGGAAGFYAYNRFKTATPVAAKSVQALEEDAKWLKNPK
jgi:hypothetical protein